VCRMQLAISPRRVPALRSAVVASVDFICESMLCPTVRLENASMIAQQSSLASPCGVR
jgi:hypothetical protein